MSPLGKRLGDDQDTVADIPGVMDFSMEGMQLGVSMDEILDPLAAPRRQGSTTGQQAGANIAPWLMDDSTPPSTPSGAASPSKGVSNTPYSQMSQVGHGNAKPTLQRLQSDMSMRTTASSRNGSQPSIKGYPAGQHDAPDQLSRHGSGDSLQTLSAPPPKPQKAAEVLPGGGRHSIVGGRAGRFGSTASSSSGGTVEKKKGGFLGGLLKRKGTGMSLGKSQAIPWSSDTDQQDH
jgi:adenylate cyclase